MHAETVADRLERFCAAAGHKNLATDLLQTIDPKILDIDVMTSNARKQFHKSVRKDFRKSAQASDLIVEIKHNARLIFPDPSREGRLITAKIALPWRNRPGNLAREIKARKLLTRCNLQVPVPKLLRYDTKKLQWLEEECISENRANSDSDKVNLFLGRYAVRLYAPAARSHHISLLLRRFQIGMSQLLDVLGETGNQIPRFDEGATWPVSLLHGDIGA